MTKEVALKAIDSFCEFKIDFSNGNRYWVRLVRGRKFLTVLGEYESGIVRFGRKYSLDTFVDKVLNDGEKLKEIYEKVGALSWFEGLILKVYLKAVEIKNRREHGKREEN